MSRFATIAAAIVLTLGAASTAFAEDDIVEKSETVVERTDVPDEVRLQFEKSEYGTWNVVEWAKVESEDHGTIYEIEAQKSEDGKRIGVYFSPDGDMLGEEVEDS